MSLETSCRAALAAAALAILPLGGPPAWAADEAPDLRPVEGSQGRWLLEVRNPRFNRVSDARLAPRLGREDALWLRANTHVFRAGLDFIDGTIEFDVAPTPECHFVAIMFRRAGYDDQENIYLRPFKSGGFDAVQYAPRINGSTWQLYPEFSAVANWPRDAWTHVRLEVAGSRMELYLDRADEPALVVPRLRAEAGRGTVGFWARVNFDNDAWGAAISNLEIRPRARSLPRLPPDDPPPGTIARWEIAGPVPAAPGAVTAIPERGAIGAPTERGAIGAPTERDGWRSIGVEESGLANLNRAIGRAGRGRFTAFARQRLVAAEAGTVPLEIGYSDEITVFLNGVPLFSGVNGWESRYPGYLGYVRLGSETVHLPLRAGANELVLAVTDDQRFGWGFAARLPPGAVRVADEGDREDSKTDTP